MADEYKSWSLVKVPVVCGKQSINPLYLVLDLSIDGQNNCVAPTFIIEAVFAPYDVWTNAVPSVRCGANSETPPKTLHGLQQQLLVPRAATGVPWNEEKYRVRRVKIV
jgi:hypothetical protein